MPATSDAGSDPEAARPPATSARACHPLPWALSAALLLLAAACAYCALRAWAPGAPGPGPPPDAQPPASLELPPDAGARLPAASQGVFAQLVAREVLLTEGLLSWHSDPGLTGVSLAPGLSYDKHTQQLLVSEPGIYYVFLRLGLRRVVAGSGSASGSVSVTLHLQPPNSGTAALAVTLDLPPPSSEALDSAAGFQGGLLYLGAGQRLSVHLSTGPGTHSAWQLAQGATVLGLFRVGSPH
nr:tumor necrosis factor ligand superfamily member 9 [Manis javanica]